MELKDFIKNTLVGIVDGIHEASDVLKSRKYDEFPFNQFSINDMEKTAYRYISFDVAIIISKETSGTASSQGKILIASVDLEGGITYSTENVSRIQFKVWCGK